MKKSIILAAALAVSAGQAYAQSAPNLIEVRQTAFSLMAGDFAGINAVIAANGDIKKLESPAKAIARYAAIIPTLFPKGTESGNNTKAKAEIWSDSAGFQKAAMNANAAALKLMETVKGGDAAAAAADAKALGGACGACHNDFRAK
jgi:cytochrome c556